MKAFLTMIGGLALPISGHAATPVVEWKANLLTVHAVDAPRQELLREVAKRTSTPILGIENVSGSFSIELDKTPLGAALRALAGGQGYAITEMLPTRKGAPLRYELQISGSGGPAPPNGPSPMAGTSFPAAPNGPSMTGGASFPAPALPQPQPPASSPVPR